MYLYVTILGLFCLEAQIKDNNNSIYFSKKIQNNSGSFVCLFDSLKCYKYLNVS